MIIRFGLSAYVMVILLWVCVDALLVKVFDRINLIMNFGRGA